MFCTFENFSIFNDCHVSDIFRSGLKFSRWSINSLGRVKIHPREILQGGHK